MLSAQRANVFLVDDSLQSRLLACSPLVQEHLRTPWCELTSPVAGPRHQFGGLSQRPGSSIMSPCRERWDGWLVALYNPIYGVGIAMGAETVVCDYMSTLCCCTHKYMHGPWCNSFSANAICVQAKGEEILPMENITCRTWSTPTVLIPLELPGGSRNESREPGRTTSITSHPQRRGERLPSAAAWIFPLGLNAILSETFQADLLQHVNLCLFISVWPYVFGKMARKPFLMEAISETKSSRLCNSLNSPGSVYNRHNAGQSRYRRSPAEGDPRCSAQSREQMPRCLKKVCPGSGLWG